MALSLKAFLGLDGSGFELGMKRAESTANAFSRKLNNSLGSKMAQFLGVAAITQAIRKTVEYASNVDDLSNRLGISAEAIQKWDYALKLSGSSIQEAVGFFEKLAVARDKALAGNPEAIKTFEKFGVSISSLKNNRLEDTAFQIGNAFKGGDQQKLIGPLKELGGKSSGALASAFKNGLADAFKGAEDILIKDSDISKLDAMGDAFDRLGKRIISTMAPALTWLADKTKIVFNNTELFIGGLMAQLGALSAGATAPEALVARVQSMVAIRAQQSKDEADADSEREKKKRENIGGGDSDEKDNAKLAKARRNTSEAVERDPFSSEGINVNALQQIGAKVSFNPMVSALQENTRALKENTIKQLAQPGNYNYRDGVQF
jgi:hypothetical protein